MQAFLILCDAGQRDMSTGKVHLLGADWTVVDARSPNMSVAVFLRTSWAEAEALNARPAPFALQLLDDQRRVVPNPDGSGPVLKVEGKLTLADVADDDAARLVDIHSSFTVTAHLAPGTLDAGKSYVWSLEIDGEEAASVAFAVRPLEPAS